jgi:uncharacterized protein involved in cysteine biosynthesis
VASLAGPTAGPLSGIVEGFKAVPMGLWLLATTRGTKRWLVPPFLITFLAMVFALWGVFSLFDRFLETVLPGEIVFGDGQWNLLDGLSERWDWLKSLWAAGAGAVQWSVNAGFQMLTSQPLKWLSYFLLGSLVAWYAFSIVYEALAGPFLDEIQGRLETRWYGADPRARLQRPNDIPARRCWKRSLTAAGLTLALVALVFSLPFLPPWLAILLVPVPILVTSALDREYGQWLSWIVGIEARAAWVSLQAAVITGIVVVLALPLYFIPFGLGYVLFACVVGFATAVGLLDIPFERRGIRLPQRLRFLGHNLLPLISFGIVAGLLLAIPLVGPLLMVPAASTGGLWLLCRLDKGHLRPRSDGGEG